MLNGVFGVLVLLTVVYANVWAVLTFLRIFARIAIALERRAGIQSEPFPPIILPAQRR